MINFLEGIIIKGGRGEEERLANADLRTMSHIMDHQIKWWGCYHVLVPFTISQAREGKGIKLSTNEVQKIERTLKPLTTQNGGYWASMSSIISQERRREGEIKTNESGYINEVKTIKPVMMP